MPEEEGEQWRKKRMKPSETGAKTGHWDLNPRPHTREAYLLLSWFISTHFIHPVAGQALEAERLISSHIGPQPLGALFQSAQMRTTESILDVQTLAPCLQRNSTQISLPPLPLRTGFPFAPTTRLRPSSNPLHTATPTRGFGLDPRPRPHYRRAHTDSAHGHPLPVLFGIAYSPSGAESTRSLGRH